MSKSNYNSVFVDWLTVSFSPDDIPTSELITFFCLLGYLKSSDEHERNFNFSYIDGSRGFIKLNLTSTYGVVSCSGQAIRYLEKMAQYMNLLALFSQQPHRVTRIDVSIDVPRDFPSIRAALKRKASKGKFSLSRKAQPYREYTSLRDDGQTSGTFYIGSSRHKVYARVYDKSLQVLQVSGIEIPTTTRYELTFRSNYGVSLKDAANPTPLFWERGTSLLLKRPNGIPDWVTGDGACDWVFKRPERLPYDVLVSKLHHSLDLKTWLVLADTMGLEGRKVLHRELGRLIFKSDSINTGDSVKQVSSKPSNIGRKGDTGT